MNTSDTTPAIPEPFALIAGQAKRIRDLSTLLRGMARRQVRTSQVGDMLAASYDKHVALFEAALKRCGWTAGTSVNALTAALAAPETSDPDAERIAGLIRAYDAEVVAHGQTKRELERLRHAVVDVLEVVTKLPGLEDAPTERLVTELRRTVAAPQAAARALTATPEET